MDKYYIFILLSFVAEVLGTISGFGSSILFVPIASMFFDFKTVLGITAIFHVFSNLSKIALFRKGINKEIALKLGIPAVIFVIIGAWLTAVIDLHKMELLMNVSLVLLALYLLVNFNKSIKQTDTNLYIGGTVSGLLAGLIGTGGAIRGITLAAFHLPKDIFIATSAIIDLGVDLSRAAIYVKQGYFDTKYLLLIPFLIGVSILGSYLGKLILQKTSETVFRYIVLIMIITTAVFNTSKYFWA
jgi:uncharacterized protein